MIPKKLFMIIVSLVLGDVITTHVGTIVFGEYFGEIGLVANLLMKTIGDSWALAMFPIELAIFGMITFMFSRNKNAFHISKKKLSLTYLPAIALSLLIANNIIQILIFTTRPL